MSNIERIKNNFGWTLRFSNEHKRYQVSITEYVHVKEEEPRVFVVCLFLLGENYPARPRASVTVKVDPAFDDQETIRCCLRGLMKGLDYKISDLLDEQSCVEKLIGAEGDRVCLS